MLGVDRWPLVFEERVYLPRLLIESASLLLTLKCYDPLTSVLADTGRSSPLLRMPVPIDSVPLLESFEEKSERLLSIGERIFFETSLCRLVVTDERLFEKLLDPRIDVWTFFMRFYK